MGYVGRLDIIINQRAFKRSAAISRIQPLAHVPECESENNASGMIMTENEVYTCNVLSVSAPIGGRTSLLAPKTGQQDRRHSSDVKDLLLFKFKLRKEARHYKYSRVSVCSSDKNNFFDRITANSL